MLRAVHSGHQNVQNRNVYRNVLYTYKLRLNISVLYCNAGVTPPLWSLTNWVQRCTDTAISPSILKSFRWMWWLRWQVYISACFRLWFSYSAAQWREGCSWWSGIHCFQRCGAGGWQCKRHSCSDSAYCLTFELLTKMPRHTQSIQLMQFY